MYFKTALTIFGLVLLIPLSAQVPGFMGKRLSVELNFQSSIAHDGPTSSNRGTDRFGELSSNLGFNTCWVGKLAYVLTRNLELVADYGYSKTGGPVSLIERDIFSPSPSGRFLDMFYNIRTTHSGLGLRYFATNRGGMAPFGPYAGFGLRWAKTVGEVNREVTSQYGDSPSDNFQDGQSANFLFGNLNFGYRHVFGNRILLNTGIDISLPFDELFGIDASFGDTNEDRFRGAALERIAYHSAIMMNIGIGILLF
ncbi:MAG: hypothetical protein AAFV95_08670 [Bacteroidota bacterium]